MKCQQCLGAVYLCDGVQVLRVAGRGGGGLHLSAVIFEEVKGGAANCINGAW